MPAKYSQYSNFYSYDFSLKKRHRKWNCLSKNSSDLLVTSMKTNMEPSGCAAQPVNVQFHLSGFEDRSDMLGEARRKFFSIAGETKPGPPLGLDWILVQQELEITDLFRKIDNDEVIFIHILYQKTYENMHLVS